MAAVEQAGDLAALRHISFFEGLDENDLDAVVAASQERRGGAGELVFSEGDEADGLYVVASGTVRIFRVDESGTEVELETLGPDELFGELALLEGGTRSASVRAVEPARLVVVDRAAFLALVERRPAVALRFVAGLSRLVRERTQRVLRDEAIRREIELQAEVDRHRTMTQLVAGVAHELNTPLGTANTAADIVAKRLATGAVSTAVAGNREAAGAIDDAREATALLLRNVARAQRLVETFKEISVQQSTEALETLDIGHLVEDVVDLFRLDAKQWGLAVELADERTDRSQAWTGHPAHLTQVLLNLLGNVGRYAYASPGGRAWVTVGSATLEGRPAFSIVVRDEGAGIAEEDRDRVFEPFFTTGRSRGGTGLGLAIVRGLVLDSLQGTIDLESNIGAGTTVTVTLPAATPA